MTESANRCFTELDLWKKARELKKVIKELIKTFPQDEKFSLSNQPLRSSRSILAAIAEGHGRFTFKDQLHFCIIARGSLSETYNHLIEASDCSYLSFEKLGI